ncbi:MAG: GTP pyrophosphokinase family protein [Clostridia bacterium]|nr:GTP pyrophosphokinase family protein [Clostridia bacterium]
MTETSIYGKYGAYLPLILQQLKAQIEQSAQDYLAKYGCALYEHLNTRLKTEDSIREKCARKSLPPTPRAALYDIKDAIGIRIVCSFIDDIYAIIARIRALDGVTIVNEKDYIKKAKPNGYRSYHLILALETPYEDVNGSTPGRYFAELQLRTIAMDSWAALEHQMKYKKNISNQALIVAELKRCADELAACDVSMQTIRELIRNS